MSATPFALPRDLLARYDQAGPRYTSYPTAPEWGSDFGPAEAVASLQANAVERAETPLSLYVHIPFCAKLCYYCGCNIHLTRDDALAERYLAALDREIGAIAQYVDTRRSVVQLHWGGGTPTHLDPDQIRRLFESLTRRFRLAADAEISIEVHPSVTTGEQLRTLADLGFNRISMGVQDFDPVVQKAVNRIQPYELTRDLVDLARELSFSSVNLDLMYGLPHQTLERFADTLGKTMAIRPDRIALFNYAHLPNLFPHQKALTDLPDPELKLTLLEQAISTFLAHGYRYIGLDHFALPENELVRALEDQTLRRNFMGYTTCAETDMLAFGMSAISELAGAYTQNQRKVPEYLAAVEAGNLPVVRGLALSADDKLRKDVIFDLACLGRVDKKRIETRHGISFDQVFAPELAELAPLAADGLVALLPDR
ncbi:MAG: oxygen-independent coproporphyrinogen III oxidase, partial [Cyanobacteria bacterium REEB65]|nr:oxygen-independent coproporphyrinogen III oxidase [Cyanobacteria bacterium REEB65]